MICYSYDIAKMKKGIPAEKCFKKIWMPDEPTPIDYVATYRKLVRLIELLNESRANPK